MDREQIERECIERIKIYSEELKKFEELLSQFVSLGDVEVGKPIESPKRVFDPAEIKEAKRKLEVLREEMDEACNRLYEAYH